MLEAYKNTKDKENMKNQIHIKTVENIGIIKISNNEKYNRLFIKRGTHD